MKLALARPALLRAKAALGQPLRPIRRQGGMRRTGDRVFVHADPRPEPARHEIEPGRRRRYRHSAHIERRQRRKVGLQAVDERLVIDDHQIVVRAVQRLRVRQTQRLQQARRYLHGPGLLGRKIHRQLVAVAAHLELAAARGEP
ncbi:hypothetical protein D3C71_1719540 [compost metagenome]